MKKVMLLVCSVALFAACGDDKSESSKSAKKCKINGVEVDCKVEEDLDLAFDISDKFVESYEEGFTLEEVVAHNEGVLKELEPYMESINREFEVDPEGAYVARTIERRREEIKEIKQTITDLNGLVFECRLYDGEEMEGEKKMDLTFENTSVRDINYMNVDYIYYDAEGNVLETDGRMMLYADFEPSTKGFLSGYRGVYESRSISLEDESKEALVDSVSVKVTEIIYE